MHIKAQKESPFNLAPSQQPPISVGCVCAQCASVKDLVAPVVIWVIIKAEHNAQLDIHYRKPSVQNRSMSQLEDLFGQMH